MLSINQLAYKQAYRKRTRTDEDECFSLTYAVSDLK